MAALGVRASLRSRSRIARSTSSTIGSYGRGNLVLSICKSEMMPTEGGRGRPETGEVGDPRTSPAQLNRVIDPRKQSPGRRREGTLSGALTSYPSSSPSSLPSSAWQNKEGPGLLQGE